MKAHLLVVPALCCLGLVSVARSADEDMLPLPRIWNPDECRSFSSADFADQVRKLKAERAALASEIKALASRAPALPKPEADAQLQSQLKNLLLRLQQSRGIVSETNPSPLQAPKELHIDKNAQPPDLRKDGDTTQPKNADPSPAPIDVVAQAHLLFRAHQYEEALAAFRQIDLKGKKAETRAPIQYLMAICLLHLGKGDEAVPLFREAANARGDDKIASYAQWQLEMHRWQRDTQARLQEFRDRRLALEKRQ